MAVRLDAVADRLSYSAAAPPATFTITAWVYLSVDRNDFSTICRIWTDLFATVGTWDVDSDGTSGPNYFTGGGSISNSTGFVVGEWRKCAITRSGSSGQILTATPAGSTEVDSGTVGTNVPAGLTIGGRDTNDTTEWFNGRFAYFRVWDSVLSQAQIEAEWDSTTPVVTSGLWADWPLATATDLTSTVNSRTLTVNAGGALTTEDGPDLGGVDGVIAGSLPALAGALAATVTSSGVVAGSLPALTGQLAAAVTSSGAVAGSLPALTGALVGDVITAGAVAGSLPALTGSLAGTTITAAVVAGALPALTGQLASAVADQGAVIAGSLPALLGELLAEITGQGVGVGGNWRDLQAILADARLLQRVDAAQRLSACPDCGEPLRSGPRGHELFCLFDGQRF